MTFEISYEQRMLVDTVRGFIKDELTPLEEMIEQTGALPDDTARAVFKKSSALGLYGMNIPEEFGGGGLSCLDQMMVEEQFGHTTDILIRRAFGNVYEVLLSCTGAQVDRWLTPAVKGERVCSIAFTEPGAGSDAAGIKTKAVRKGDKWVLSGMKHYISDGSFSDFFVVTAVTDPSKGHRGISMFLVDKGMPGFSLGRDQAMMGIRGTSHLDLHFDEVELTDDHLLGTEGEGLKLALSVLGRVRLAQVAARAIGKSTKILQMTLDHARDRHQFGQSLGDFQMVQQMLADSAIEINAARAALWDCAAQLDAGQDVRTKISALKVQGAETLGRVVDRAVQIYGGMGFSKDLPIERYYRDARIYRIFDGASEVHRSVIAKTMLKGSTSVFDPWSA
ncbi:acyl-CoA dehydrogenase family protein [Pseudoprimorskyibacter insulae]|uniref:Acryloyl-CoA reductase (NADH) n=1 Tax=Pseudoprimorskyibacter insulae TaxID=1695997 RepID=A0A2R8AY16_9RHOB|nr:acyl-CoA dehydrogenase family protein [Pseudoprimorskyibacter insulae]SPF80931.1 Acryloyl-CoA reductase (NADH) [Pseudoprimorskyibacter insulae]